MIESLVYQTKSGGAKESGEQLVWTPAPTDPVRYGHGALVVGDEMFMAGGFNPSGTIVTTFQKYNFITKQWTTLAPLLASGLRYSTLINVNGDIRPVGLGNRKDAYALTGNAWRSLGSSPEWITYGYVSGWYKGKFYQIGGDGSTVNGVQRTRQSFVEWDPATDKWTVLLNTPFPGTYACGGVIGDKFWVYGGNGVVAGTPYIWFYDFITKVWTQGPQHPSGLGRAQCFYASRGDRIIIGAGTDVTNGRSREVYAFDLTSMGWERLKDVDVAGFTSGSSVVYDNKIWVYGGIAGGALNQFFSYDITRS